MLRRPMAGLLGVHVDISKYLRPLECLLSTALCQHQHHLQYLLSAYQKTLVSFPASSAIRQHAQPDRKSPHKQCWGSNTSTRARKVLEQSEHLLLLWHSLRTRYLAHMSQVRALDFFPSSKRNAHDNCQI
jgi:hypothetical protein